MAYHIDYDQDSFAAWASHDFPNGLDPADGSNELPPTSQPPQEWVKAGGVEPASASDNQMPVQPGHQTQSQQWPGAALALPPVPDGVHGMSLRDKERAMVDWLRHQLNYAKLPVEDVITHWAITRPELGLMVLMSDGRMQLSWTQDATQWWTEMIQGVRSSRSRHR